MQVKTKEVWEAVEKGCINFNNEFRCPNCGKLLVPVCVNLGVVRVGNKEKLYCARGFPDDCTQYGCPKYIFVDWLERYRKTGKL